VFRGLEKVTVCGLQLGADGRTGEIWIQPASGRSWYSNGIVADGPEIATTRRDRDGGTQDPTLG
jgi:hypothetical protein